MLFFTTFIGLFIMFSVFIILGFLLPYSIKSAAYHRTVYYKMTHHPLFKIFLSKGLLGEYLTYKNLRSLKGHPRFLFNLYLPKENDETTEIDVILVHNSGVYVFESKNYSGWIFGSEHQRTWTRSLPHERDSIKNHFLNPIMQNKLHINYLKKYLSDFPDIVIHSMILFSDRCALKKINLQDSQVEVMNRHSVLGRVQKQAEETGSVLTDELIDSIYQTLYPYTQVTKGIRNSHIEAIQNHHKGGNTDTKSEAAVETAATAEVKVAPVQTAATEKPCPKCGKLLTLRTAKRGAHAGEHFWGCTGYPHCRYMEKTDK